MLRFILSFFVVSIFAQDPLGRISSPMDLLLVPSFKNHVAQLDLQNLAGVYATRPSGGINSNTYAYVSGNLGSHLSINEIHYREIDIPQYEICCDMFGFSAKTSQVMLIIYHNGNAFQFAFGEGQVNLLQELRKLGWVSTEERIREFLKSNPYNQDALGELFYLVSRNMSGSNAVGTFIDALKMINRSDSLDWMTNQAALTATLLLATRGGSQALKESRELQQEINHFMQLIEDDIIQRPYFGLRYIHWASFAALSNNPDPMKLLSRLSFPHANNRKAPPFVSMFARLFFLSPRVGEDQKPIVDEGFKLLSAIEEWMMTYDPFLDSVFSDAFADLVTSKVGYLIQYQRYSELEKFLEETRIKIGPNWSQIANELKNPRLSNLTRLMNEMPGTNKNKLIEILELSAISREKKIFNGLMVSHNLSKVSLDKLHGVLLQGKVYFYLTHDVRLPQDSWLLNNSNVYIGSGSIVPNEDDLNGSTEFSELLGMIRNEERKNLNAMERFIFQNPGNYDAMDMYCTEAAKFLPDEVLEVKIYNYSRITNTPPSLEAYSKMTSKDNWSRLASQVIAEGLLQLNDAPFGLERNPWLNLSQWEDLDLNKNAIDWYAFIKDTVFWYKPMYYLQKIAMPDVVFIKYLTYAEGAMDWTTVLSACEARFTYDKANCQNETILATWNQAEEKLNNLDSRDS